jgi:hypothetical protein
MKSLMEEVYNAWARTSYGRRLNVGPESSISILLTLLIACWVPPTAILTCKLLFPPGSIGVLSRDAPSELLCLGRFPM